MLYPFCTWIRNYSGLFKGSLWSFLGEIVSLMLLLLYIFHFSVWTMAVITNFAGTVIQFDWTLKKICLDHFFLLWYGSTPPPSAHGRIAYFPTRDLIHTIFAQILVKKNYMDFLDDNNKIGCSFLNNISMLIFSMLITNSINIFLRSLLFIFIIVKVLIVKTNKNPGLHLKINKRQFILQLWLLHRSTDLGYSECCVLAWQVFNKVFILKGQRKV